MVVVFDIDGVIADNTHRLRFMRKRDYDSFYSRNEVMKDTPIEDGITLLKALRNEDIYFVTGRPENCKGATVEWMRSVLQKHGVEFFENRLRMRKMGDYRKATVVKKELIETIFREKEELSFFDDEQNRKGLFIDDDPNNVVAISDEFPDMTGIVFGVGRLSELKKKEASFSLL
jgi:hypothetical protein